jgi:hypothetical protein
MTPPVGAMPPCLPRNANVFSRNCRNENRMIDLVDLAEQYLQEQGAIVIPNEGTRLSGWPR